jgi:hypothetical protein
VSAAARPLSIVLAAQDFVRQWRQSMHQPLIAVAAGNAAIVWCGGSPERESARLAFTAVAVLLASEGDGPLVDPGPYVGLVARVMESARR